MSETQILVVWIAAVAAAPVVSGLIWWHYGGGKPRFSFTGLIVPSVGLWLPNVSQMIPSETSCALPQRKSPFAHGLHYAKNKLQHDKLPSLHSVAASSTSSTCSYTKEAFPSPLPASITLRLLKLALEPIDDEDSLSTQDEANYTDFIDRSSDIIP